MKKILKLFDNKVSDTSKVSDTLTLEGKDLGGNFKLFKLPPKLSAIKFAFFLNIILIILFISCNKTELPPPVNEDPVFYLKGNLEGAAFDIKAGEDNYVLFTEFEKDEEDIHTFIGSFSQIDCGLECRDTFVIKIRDFQAVPFGSVDILNALKPEDYNYNNNDSVLEYVFDTTMFYFAEFDAGSSILPNFGNVIYSWNFGDNQTFATPIPTISHQYSSINTLGFLVTLTLNNNMTCSSTQTINLSFDPNNVNNQCSVKIIPDSTSGPVFPPAFLEAVATGVAPFSYQWSNGSGSVSIPFNPNTSNNDSVMITDANGCESLASVAVIGAGVIDLCFAAFEAEAIIETDIEVVDSFFVTDLFQFSTVVIEYKDSDGNFYSSELGPQSGTGTDSPKLTILSVEDFENNERGEKTKKMGLTFECFLYNENGLAPLFLADGQGVIGVSYPD